MKVNSIQVNTIINLYNRQNQHIKPESTSKVYKDKVVISDDAKYLSKINNDNENINLDKVNEIKKKIKEGIYDVNSRNIAKKMLNGIKGEKDK
ncbi:flagellar biosynthesis anti-sigma factor FlgM [Clostridium sp. D53t1_180928_C8]|uniref:flagellar biosynthesis anti-sigma factor FlgM n=1 Tax=Clostridium sp. D53t1_180928_C8 TaxID=2787101 RepID=UPI0018AB6BA5|nr:flagellar biosynthesis anti-sigma factor FlgM [Clostridium sp. D53t1_180928_C8]